MDEGEELHEMEGMEDMEEMEEHEGSPGTGDEIEEEEKFHGGHDSAGESGEESLDFENNPNFAGLPPLDRMRKIRREVVRSVNEMRQRHERTSLFMDTFQNKAATEYAEYLLHAAEDEGVLTEICKRHWVPENLICVIGDALLEEEASNDEKDLHSCFMDAHGVLFELEDDLRKILTKEMTHIGVGMAWNN